MKNKDKPFLIEFFILFFFPVTPHIYQLIYFVIELLSSLKPTEVYTSP